MTGRNEEGNGGGQERRKRVGGSLKGGGRLFNHPLPRSPSLRLVRWVPCFWRHLSFLADLAIWPRCNANLLDP